MTRSCGATLRYAYLIAGLDDDVLYTAGSIAHRDPEAAQGMTRYNRIRSSLGAFARYHLMHEEPDGYIRQYKAWRGATWKSYAKPEDMRDTKPQRNYFGFVRGRAFWLGCLGFVAGMAERGLW